MRKMEIINSESIKLEEKRPGKTPDDDKTKNVEVVVPLKNLINFWRNFRVTFLNRSRHKGYFLPKVKLDNYNVMIYEKNIFDQPIKDDNMKML